MDFFLYICDYNPYLFCVMNGNKNVCLKIVGWLGVAIVLLLLAICVFIVWGCALVHWLLAAGVGCFLAVGWLTVGVFAVAGYVNRGMQA